MLWKKKKMLVTGNFSSAYPYCQGRQFRILYFFRIMTLFYSEKNLTFCNISVITQDIFLKLGICAHCLKSNPYYQGRQLKMHFIQNYAPFFNLEFLYSMKHPTAKQWHPHAMLLFPFPSVFYSITKRN